MELFEILPERFFTLLIGKYRTVYAEAVLELYEQYKNSRIGIDYEIMRDLFQELLEVKAEAGISFEIDEEASEESFGLTNYRKQANALLRKLQDLEWIDIETRDNFKQYIVLPHYTIRMLGTMQELCSVRSVELQGYALNTYNLLSSDEMEKQPSLAITQAERVTAQLLEELRILINNMKHQMEEVISKQSLQEVLDHHFDTYMKDIVDRSYHRLKTSDHVARYRSRIIETVQKWLLDQNLLDLAVEDALKSEMFGTREETEQRMRQALQSIEEVYEGLDDIYEQIDIRHHQYLKSSYDRARYLTQHNQGIGHQIALILENRGRADADWDAFMQEAFHLQKTEALAETSLLTPRKKRAMHEPEQHTIIPISEELKNEIRHQSIKKLENAISKEKVDKYVLERLGNRNEMGMRDLAPTTIEEYVYLPYVYLYGYEKKSAYSLIREKEQHVLIIGDYRFVDRKVVRNTREGNLNVSEY